MIPKNRLASVRTLKEDCKKRGQRSYQVAKQKEDIDVTQSLLYALSGRTESQLYFVYGFLEEIMESINNIGTAIRKLPSQEEFRAAKNELKKTIEKEFTPTQDDIEREKRSRDVYR